jgi:alcohol dehydrogenase class IV
MISTFSFQLDNRLRYGFGASRSLDAFVKEHGWNHIALVADQGVIPLPYFQTVQSLLKSVAQIHLVSVRSSEEPSYDYLDQLAETVRKIPTIDALIAIGGGSAMDIGKALAVLRTNPGPALNYRGFDKVTVPGVPSICIPTTAGTGSEVTINAVFTDKAEMKKLGINGRYLNATYAILDGEWTINCPLHIAVSSGMDALVHTLESFMTTNANPLTRALNREAFKLLYENLPALVDAPNNPEKRQLILLGAYLAAAGLFNSGSGVAGAMSYPIGVHFKVPHGIAGGILISSIVAHNVEQGYHDYAELLDMVEQHPDWSKEKKAQRLGNAIRDLANHLGVPHTLGQWGINRQNLDHVVELMAPLQGAFNQNPVPFGTGSDARKILLQHTE